MGLKKKLKTLRDNGLLTESEYIRLKNLKTSEDRITGLEGACKQFMWERDVAISQLKDLGYSFAEKTEPIVPQIRKAIDDLCVQIMNSGLSLIDKQEVMTILDKFDKTKGRDE